MDVATSNCSRAAASIHHAATDSGKWNAQHCSRRRSAGMSSY